MSTLSTKDKDTVKAHKVPGKEELIDADALATILAVYPQAKRFVSHFELSPDSEQMKEHGKPIVTGVGEAVANIDDLTPGLLNFKILSHILLVVLARTLPKEFAPEVHVCMDKFLARVSYALSEKPQAEASVVSAQ